MTEARWSRAEIALAALAFGAVSIGTQSVVLRQFLAVVSAHESLLGIVLGVWLALTGAGAFAGEYLVRWKLPAAILLKLILISSLLPAGTVLLIPVARSLAFAPGTMVGLPETALTALAILTPTCMVTGGVFVVLAHLAAESRQGAIAEVYAWEAAGSVAGGTAFNLLLISVLTPLRAGMLLSLCMLAVWLGLSKGRVSVRRRLLAVSVALGVILILSGTHAERSIIARLYPNQELVEVCESPYGTITVTRQSSQTNIFENGVLLCSSGDPVPSEEAVHFAMAQRPRAASVLLVSGGITGMMREILKYPVERIDDVEVNPWLIDVGKRYTDQLTDARVHTVQGDAWRYLSGPGIRYDVVILAVPDPVSLSLNRFYTREFYEKVKRRMTEDGVVSFGLLPSAEYYGPEARDLTSTVYATVRRSFREIAILPGTRNYFLASDGHVDCAVAGLVGKAGVVNSYVNSWYLDDAMLCDRNAEIIRAMDVGARENRQFAPAGVFSYLRYWLSGFGVGPLVLLLLVTVILILALPRTETIGVGLFAGGFAGAAIEIVLLMCYQVLHGYLYAAIGLLITLFMAGLAVGSFIGTRVTERASMRTFAVVLFVLGAASLAVPLFVVALEELALPDTIVQLLFGLQMVVLAALVGFLFAAATKARTGGTGAIASRAYGMDLLGSSAGAVLSSVAMIPLLGIIGTGATSAALCGGGGLLCLLRIRRCNGVGELSRAATSKEG